MVPVPSRLPKGKNGGVHVAPIYINFGERTYRAGIDLNDAEFYRLLAASKKLPTTAQPTAADFLDIYNRLADEVDEIVTNS